MSVWKKIVLINSGGLVGIFVSLFLVSPRTPLWLWAVLSLVVLAALNYFSFSWRQEPTGESRAGVNSTAIIVLGFILLLLDLILRYLHW